MFEWSSARALQKAMYLSGYKAECNDLTRPVARPVLRMHRVRYHARHGQEPLPLVAITSCPGIGALFGCLCACG